jgi:hypothetical protein
MNIERFLIPDLDLTIDLHGYHPSTIEGGGILSNVLQQAWEMGRQRVVFIHGHGLKHGSPRPFANTNTGWLGLTVRTVLRSNVELRKWAYAKIDVSRAGATTMRVKPNPSPSRLVFDGAFFPELDCYH